MDLKVKNDWYIDVDGDLIAYDEDGGRMLAEIVDATEEEQNIMTAGPELLKACEESLREFDEMANEGCEGYKELAGKIRNAIYKATGK